MPRWLDFRSDTITRPTPAMRQAMANAEVGDDVFGEDPTVLALEARTAELLGKEAAVYVPSGTMSNQLGVRVHCQPGDEMICEASCHILNYEQAGYAQLSAVAARPIAGRYGVLDVEQLTGLIRPADDHYPRSRVVCLENTHNRGGGRILPLDKVAAICGWAHGQGLATHLDGARLFNAVVATGTPAHEWASHFDTVSVCFSKGLGAPVGSALAGPKDLIRKARRARKLLGGGMRQAGVIAAGALYGLNHHIERLAEDHVNARELAKAISAIDGLALDPPDVDTNIVIFLVSPKLGTAAEFCARLKEAGVLMLPIAAQQVRALAHLDVSREDVKAAVEVLRRVAGELAYGAKPGGNGPTGATSTSVSSAYRG
ncbi:MAG: aminotransferase class I/II-fold pyridoxal phosphate-dependent enzyme [Pirellulales bacterium]|nr:aminotransferase class I/II-fold pyridoxal phosphate-dependent enzyme [Pirellulales bacterium]